MDWHGFVKKTTEINAKIFCLILLFLFSCFQSASASINRAAKKAGITKISYIDVHEKSIFIFFRKLTVNVYGE